MTILWDPPPAPPWPETDPNLPGPQLRIPFRRLLQVLFWPLVLRLYWGRTPAVICGPRFEWEAETPHRWRVRLVVDDLTKPEAYSREELFWMLATVRAHEALMGWKCPESPVLRSVRGRRS